ncbi:hypothetical protein ACSS6W_007438 [Trichoderma asperelloides]
MNALETSLAGPRRQKNSCSLCKQRKQKCNRIWPCTNCAKRDESMNCSFTKTSAVSRQSAARKSNAARKNRRRKIAAAAEAALQTGEESSNAAVVQTADKEDRRNSSHGLNLDGDDYKQTANCSATVRPDDLHCPENQHSEQQPPALEAGVEAKPPPFEKRHDDQYRISAPDCKLLQEALDTLPQRRDHMDALVLSFFQNVNPHYGLIHQAEFAVEYTAWWEKRANNDPLPIPWTCLLLMLCACACQHLPVDIQEKLEEMFHASCQNLTESYHYCARNLYGVIPEGQYHRHNVMWLLHSTYWYKAEALFVECCHIFNTAVREAQELVMNTAPAEDYAYLPDGKDDTEQAVLSAALESISLSAENRIDPGKQRQKVAGALIEVYTNAAEPGLQPSPFSHNDDSVASAADECHGCHENHEHHGNDAPISHNAAISIPLPNYDEQRVPGHHAAASEEHILPTSSAYGPAVPSNDAATAPPIEFTSDSSYVGPPSALNYNQSIPLEQVTSTSPDYTIAASLTDPAIASAYIEPTALNHAFFTPLGGMGVAFSNDTSIAPFVYDDTLPLDYGAITSSNYDAPLSSVYSTTGPHAEATLPLYNAFAYLENNGVISTDNFTENPPLFSAPTAYDVLASNQIQPFPGYDVTGLDTSYGFYNDPAGSQNFVPDTAPITHPTSANSVSYSSPETYPYSEAYSAPALYNAATPYSDRTTCVDSATSFESPESNLSSANFDVAEAHAATAAAATAAAAMAHGTYAHAECSEDGA